MANLSVTIPCFNEFTVGELVNELRQYDIEVIIIDDGSCIPIKEATIRHTENQGYGASLKTGILNATRDYILTMDGDGQHQVSDVLKMWIYFQLLEDYDMLIGVRKIPAVDFIRYLGRKGLNLIASLWVGMWLPDLNSGFRIFKKEIALNYMPILCDTYSFTTSITLMFLIDNYKVEWMPIQVKDRVIGKSKVNIIKHGLITLYYILKIGFALRTRTIRRWIRPITKRLLGR
jgi:glycosyltransferase involved in cell wall biosynthesis